VSSGVLAAQAGKQPGGQVIRGKVTGFKDYTRDTPARRPVEERVNDYFEVYLPTRREGAHAGGRGAWIADPFCHTGAR